MRVAPYGDWSSPVTPELIAQSGYFGVEGLEVDGEDVYWGESRPNEGGRTAVVRWRPDGSVTDLLPSPWNIRTTVHEYGGRAFTAVDGTIWFSNVPDCRLYELQPGGEPRPIVPPGPMRYADPCVDLRRRVLYCVREDHSGEGEPVNTLVRVPLDGGEGTVIASGYDFYGSPRLRPDGAQLAFIAWRHPNMPWDDTELFLADLLPDGSLDTPRRVAGGPKESVLFPSWSADGTLYFISDRAGFWNLYRLANGSSEVVGPTGVDCGGVPRVLGRGAYDASGPDSIWYSTTRNGIQQIVTLDPRSLQVTEVPTPLTFISTLIAHGDGAIVVGAGPRARSAVSIVSPNGALTPLRPRAEDDVPESYISIPEGLSFPTDGGSTAHAFFYPPTNPEYSASPDTLPPLIVNVHGGPVGATYPVLNLDIQFWTTRGYAVVDVNYRGSIGWGRAYREQLYGQWGVADVDDCIAAAQYLIERGRVDPQRVVIRGPSAGGYTTLAALAFRDFFHAGLSFCGVSDPERFMLPGGTHKFESRYLVQLIGRYPEEVELYHSRSPIHNADNITVPLLLLQGLEDHVVPPEQARIIAENLQRRGIPVELAEFEGEGHGFRRADSLQRFYETELAFLERILSLTKPRESIA